MNPLISVVVPVYNGERYLHECIDSILNQTFTDLELICLMMVVQIIQVRYVMIMP